MDDVFTTCFRTSGFYFVFKILIFDDFPLLTSSPQDYERKGSRVDGRGDKANLEFHPFELQSEILVKTRLL